jgi:hypothetical protein
MRKQRGAVTLEALMVIAMLAIPLMLLLASWGAQSFAEYKTAREHVLQAYP